MSSNDNSALLIVAHGSTVNPDSSAPTLAHAAEIRRRKIFANVECAFWKVAAVLNVYMEEPPLVSDWRKLTRTPNVVVVPFFISDGLHSYEDIPVLLGIVDAAPSPRLSQEGATGRHVHHGRGEIFRQN